MSNVLKEYIRKVVGSVLSESAQVSPEDEASPLYQLLLRNGWDETGNPYARNHGESHGDVARNWAGWKAWMLRYPDEDFTLEELIHQFPDEGESAWEWYIDSKDEARQERALTSEPHDFSSRDEDD